MDAAQISVLITALIPVLAPVGVNLIKKATGDKFSKLNPIFCTFLGLVGDTVNYFITGHNLGPVWGLVLGGLGVAVRETVNQLRS